ncbi:hypothetical protein [Oceanirhabdus sp. W0125-5]|uniref:hypothetical protein n=1 Tax=Oceanirhabdus sp. W0125-5 TaxID=2999116 RepID=UPI0022F3005A|nr:hypothetical protein [Oceanirhabdus sp. W0125-5]WBW96122.1 hypothetical protein OW730_20870 [Oceanirhabdus sp. W0125-5]
MGLSGILLKKKEEFDFDKLIYDIRYAANKASIICLDGIEFEKNDDGRYEFMTFVLKDNEVDTDNQFIMYAYNDVENMLDGIFDFIDEKNNYQQCINIEDFRACKMLLNFIYEYMKLNLYDIFYNELKWYYTFEDIEKIAKSEIFDSEWCYKNPCK